jgi:hypothetical protein
MAFLRWETRALLIGRGEAAPEGFGGPRVYLRGLKNAVVRKTGGILEDVPGEGRWTGRAYAVSTWLAIFGRLSTTKPIAAARRRREMGTPFSASSEGRREIEAIELGSFDCFGFPSRSERFEGR